MKSIHGWRDSSEQNKYGDGWHGTAAGHTPIRAGRPFGKTRVRSDGEELFDGIVAEFGHGAGGADRSALKDGEVITEFAAEI